MNKLFCSIFSFLLFFSHGRCFMQSICKANLGFCILFCIVATHNSSSDRFIDEILFLLAWCCRFVFMRDPVEPHDMGWGVKVSGMVMQVLLTKVFKETWLHEGARLVNSCWGHQHSPTSQLTEPSGRVKHFLPTACFLSLPVGSTPRPWGVIVATYKVGISLQKALARVFDFITDAVSQQHLSFLENSL